MKRWGFGEDLRRTNPAAHNGSGLDDRRRVNYWFVSFRKTRAGVVYQTDSTYHPVVLFL